MSNIDLCTEIYTAYSALQCMKPTSCLIKPNLVQFRYRNWFTSHPRVVKILKIVRCLWSCAYSHSCWHTPITIKITRQAVITYIWIVTLYNNIRERIGENGFDICRVHSWLAYGSTWSRAINYDGYYQSFIQLYIWIDISHELPLTVTLESVNDNALFFFIWLQLYVVVSLYM